MIEELSNRSIVIFSCNKKFGKNSYIDRSWLERYATGVTLTANSLELSPNKSFVRYPPTENNFYIALSGTPDEDYYYTVHHLFHDLRTTLGFISANIDNRRKDIMSSIAYVLLAFYKGAPPTAAQALTFITSKPFIRLALEGWPELYDDFKNNVTSLDILSKIEFDYYFHNVLK